MRSLMALHEEMVKDRGKEFERPWGRVLATRYDAAYNKLVNFRDEDGGWHLRVEFTDGCVQQKVIGADKLDEFLAVMDRHEDRLNWLIGERKKVQGKIQELQNDAHLLAQQMFSVANGAAQ